MKNFLNILAFCILGFTACKKGTLQADNGCISRISKSAGVSVSDSLAAVDLLKKNSIPYNNLVFYRVTLNDTVTIQSINETSVHQHIFANQYFNGLQLFGSQVGFHFKNSIFQSETGSRHGVITLSTTPLLNLPQVRALFLHAASAKAGIKDSCLVAEFGYYDLNGNVTGAQPNVVKAWYVTPKYSDYPVGIFRDDNGKTISYFDGIFTID